MAFLSAYVGTSGLADMGYAFYTNAEVIIGSRVTSGIVDASDGWYSTNAATIPSNAQSVRWNSTGTTSAIAREYFYDQGAASSVWAQPMTELSSVPAVTGTMLQAVEWVFLLARNKITSTSTTQTLRNDADSAAIGSSAVSDDGTTFTRGEFA